MKRPHIVSGHQWWRRRHYAECICGEAGPLRWTKASARLDSIEHVVTCLRPERAARGQVFMAPTGTPLPKSLADPDWIELGYLSEDGLR